MANDVWNDLKRFAEYIEDPKKRMEFLAAIELVRHLPVPKDPKGD